MLENKCARGATNARARDPQEGLAPMSDAILPCESCGGPKERPRQRRFCSDKCRAAYWASPQRFWDKVDKNGPIPSHAPDLGPCWVWTRSRNRGGYGLFRVGGACRLAHRFAWFLHYRRWPEPQALHRCDGGSLGCVRISHLYEGDDLTNAHDKLERGRWRSGAKGERNGLAKLCAADIPEIRAALARGESKCSLGRRFGVDPSAIYAIAKGLTWSHVRD